MSSQKNRIYILLFLIFLSRAEISRAQDTGNDEAPIRVNTVLLNIPVVASDKQGRNASNLKKENFSVIQDGEKQPIVFFCRPGGPMNVAIIMDVSGSVRSVISDIRRAARNFVAFFSPNDSGMIVSFDKGVHILQPLTSSQKKLAEGISAAFISDEPGSMSNMNDAIFRVVTKDFASIKGRKAIVVLTDGYVGGKISNQRLLDVLIESDILVYPIFYQTQPIILPKGNEKSRFAAKTITLNELVKNTPF